MTTPQSPQEAFGYLMQELSASASDPLLDNDDPNRKFTLRGAIKRILWKVNQLLPLANRPVDPTKPDDLYGHVLSMRVEQLQTQAVVADLAARLGTDVPKIFNQVKAGLNVVA